jgi:hypothetical protein
MSTVDELTVQTPMVSVNGRSVGGDGPDVEVRARRVPGLRLKRVPSGPLFAQILGALLFLAGLFLICAIAWGIPTAVAVTMLTTGAATVVLGVLREANII